MHKGSSAGEGAGVRLPEPAAACMVEGVGGLKPDEMFAVIHDEAFFAIVYDNGQFKGTVVDADPDKLKRARAIAASYNLIIYHVQPDGYSNYDLRLREVHAPG